MKISNLQQVLSEYKDQTQRLIIAKRINNRESLRRMQVFCNAQSELDAVDQVINHPVELIELDFTEDQEIGFNIFECGKDGK